MGVSFECTPLKDTLDVIGGNKVLNYKSVLLIERLKWQNHILQVDTWGYDHVDLVVGLRFIHEPKTLRFFTGTLESTSDLPEKLAEANIADF